jgi:hypothetical protein
MKRILAFFAVLFGGEAIKYREYFVYNWYKFSGFIRKCLS